MACCTSAVPAQFQSGDSVAFTLTDTNFPATEWTAQFLMFRQGKTTITTNGATNGTSYDFAINSATSTNIAPEDWNYCVRFTNTSNAAVKSPLQWQGAVFVLSDPTVTYDPTVDEALLAALDAAILTLSGSANQSVSFNGQSYSRQSIDMLRQWRTQLQAGIYQQKARMAAHRGINTSGLIGVSFVPAQPYCYPWNQPGACVSCP